jgi:hypothetical protein
VDDIYILAFFLHPAYKGAALRHGQFHSLVLKAGGIWQGMGKSGASYEILVTQFRAYRLKQAPYDLPYVSGRDTPITWWNTCETQPAYIQTLALKIFSIIPNSASCERVFSSLGHIYGKRRQKLKINKLEGLAKIYRYNISNMEQEMKFAKNGRDFHYTPEELQEIIQNNFGDLDDENTNQETDLMDELKNLEAEERNSELVDNSNITLNVADLFDLNVVEEKEQNELENLYDMDDNGDASSDETEWDPQFILQRLDPDNE